MDRTEKQGCQMPENLKSAQQGCTLEECRICDERTECDDVVTDASGCTVEQIRECHGDTEGHPCVETPGCEHPERLKGKPGDCSPEQIRQCHGDDRSHRC